MLPWPETRRVQRWREDRWQERCEQGRKSRKNEDCRGHFRERHLYKQRNAPFINAGKESFPSSRKGGLKKQFEPMWLPGWTLDEHVTKSSLNHQTRLIAISARAFLKLATELLHMITPHQVSVPIVQVGKHGKGHVQNSNK